jgi:hypothetical protein
MIVDALHKNQGRAPQCLIWAIRQTSFLLKDILSRKKISVCRYFGVGVRYGLDSAMAYTTSYATIVEVSSRIGRAFCFFIKISKVSEIINKYSN